mgnify:FL=1
MMTNEILFGKKLKENIGNLFLSSDKYENGLMVLISPFFSEPKLFDPQEIPANIFQLINLELDLDRKIILITDDTNYKEKDYIEDFFKKLDEENISRNLFLFAVNNLHSKLFIKKNYAILGSMNLTFSGINLNKEMAVKIYENKDLNSIKAYFGYLLIESEPLNENAKKLKKWLAKQKLSNYSKKWKIYDKINDEYK